MRCLPTILFVLVCGLTSGCAPQPDAVRPAAPEETPLESAKAGVGVGQQGRSLDGDTGVQQMISAPVSAYFKTKEKIAFEVAVPHALNLFKASEGRLPKSHEEYMEKIIKANQIVLPALPDGMTYRFDPSVGELWVHPTNATQTGAPGAGGAAPGQ
jgi:hypothetical protein